MEFDELESLFIAFAPVIDAFEAFNDNMSGRLESGSSQSDKSLLDGDVDSEDGVVCMFAMVRDLKSLTSLERSFLVLRLVLLEDLMDILPLDLDLTIEMEPALDELGSWLEGDVFALVFVVISEFFSVTVL